MIKTYICFFENGQFAECQALSGASAKAFVSAFYKMPVVKVELATEYPLELHNAVWGAK